MSAENDNESPNFLDQSDIDRLLAQAEDDLKKSIFRSNGEPFPDPDSLKIENFDFRNPVFLTEIELRRLRLMHEDFIRYLSARLSLFLRMEINLKMARLSTVTYDNLIDTMANPTHLALFKAEPLQGIGLLEINPRLALTVVDRILGGQGHSVKTERYLTEIETAILEDIEMIILEEWCNQWKNEQELRPTILGHENTGRFLQTSPRNAVILGLAIEAQFGDCVETLQLSLPYYTIEPILKAIQSRRHKESDIGQMERHTAWHPAYANITVPVRAEWEAGEVTLREVLHWRVGDILALSPEIAEATRVRIADKGKFQGRAGVENERFAVEITGLDPQSPLPARHDDRN